MTSRMHALLLMPILLQACAHPVAPTAPVAPEAKATEPLSQAPMPEVVDAQPAAFRHGPPFGPVWCTRARDTIPESIVRRHVPKDAQLETMTAPERCDEGLHADIAPGEKLRISVGCGTFYYDDLYKDEKVRGAYDEEVQALLALPRTTPNHPLAGFYLWDSNTPCTWRFSWSGSSPKEERMRRLRALAKDLAQHLTPQVIARPRAELVIAAEDETGEAARAALARWPDVKPAIDAVVPLSPGYPKIVRSDDFPELPKGKHFLLLAVCTGYQGYDLTTGLWAAFRDPREPSKSKAGAWILNVDAEGLSHDCPNNVPLMPPSGHSAVQSSNETLPDGRTLSVISAVNAQAKGGEVLARTAAILYAPDFRVLATKSSEIVRPPDLEHVQGRYETDASKHYGACEGGFNGADKTTVHIGCDLRWSDYPCRYVPQHEVFSRFYTATEHDTIEVREEAYVHNGKGCFSKE